MIWIIFYMCCYQCSVLFKCNNIQTIEKTGLTGLCCCCSQRFPSFFCQKYFQVGLHMGGSPKKAREKMKIFAIGWRGLARHKVFFLQILFFKPFRIKTCFAFSLDCLLFISSILHDFEGCH